MDPTRTVLRNAKLSGKQIEDLRVTVGWDRMDGYYDRILARSYAHFSVHDEDGNLIAFVNVISDGIGDAFLVDLIVHPDDQGKGIGQALVTKAINDLRSDGIRTIEVIFQPYLETFYRACGFHIMQSGIIDTWKP
jgi:N-acetylglutamate synthase-like GNAT family acetyltransferase